MSLLAVAPGPLATVQDVGRFGLRGFGVPVSGPFDRRSAALANALAGNDPGAAVLELTGLGGVFEAECDLAVAMAGAEMPARIESDGRVRAELIGGFVTGLRAGDRLVIGRARVGFRAYLAVRGGWQTEIVAGSRSNEEPIRAGDRLPASASWSLTRWRTATLGEVAPGAVPIRYVEGPDAHLLEPGTLERASFRVGMQSDRMGVRLEGEAFEIEPPADRLSSPVAPGTVQIAGGRPIALGPACGTMGGYPHVAQVLTRDLDLLAQKRPGAEVQFSQISIEEARAIDRVYRSELASECLRLRVAFS